MPTRKDKSPSAHAPWTAKKKAAMEAEPSNRPFIYLLTDVEGAQLLVEGKIPEYLQEQCARALDWMQ